MEDIAIGGAAGPPVTVRLLGAPLDLLVAAREHHEAVVRELSLVAVMTTPQHLPPRLAELVEVFSHPYVRPDAAVDEALARGERTADLTYAVPGDAGPAVADLEGQLDELDGFCEQGLLITLPRSAHVRAFAGWYLAQLREQLAGGTAVPWPS